MGWTKRTGLMVTMALVASFWTSVAATQDVVVITPPGYEVIQTPSQQLTTPPSTQLAQPQLTVPVTHAPGAEVDAPATRANRGLVVGGAISLGVGYVGNMVGSLLYSSLRAISGVANTDEFLGFAFVPIAGPWLQLPFASTDMEVGFLIGAGMLQAAGVTMLIAGLTFARKPVTEVQLSDNSSVTFTPMVTGDSAGLTAIGTF